jgi:hypothetical protein
VLTMMAFANSGCLFVFLLKKESYKFCSLMFKWLVIFVSFLLFFLSDCLENIFPRITFLCSNGYISA